VSVNWWKMVDGVIAISGGVHGDTATEHQRLGGGHPPLADAALHGSEQSVGEGSGVFALQAPQ
jgi:hypothetical protein